MGRTGHRLAAVALVALAVGGLSTGVVAGVGTPAADAPDGESALAPAVVAFEPDSVAIEIRLELDGSAVWRVAYRTRLDDANATATYERTRERVDSRPLELAGPFRDAMATDATAAAAETGREMVIRNVSVDATRRAVPAAYGVVTFTFEWTEFAAVGPSGRMRVGAALSEFFLTERTTLLVTWPGEYRHDAVTPPPDERTDNSVAWTGRREFAPGAPRLELAPRSPVRRFVSRLPLLGIAAVGVGALGVGAWVRRRRAADGEPAESATTAAPDASDDADGTAEPWDLLSNEEKVLRLLEESGGRMKQQELVAETGWSETKASQVVAGLEEAGRVETYRLGRENVLALPGEMDV